MQICGVCFRCCQDEDILLQKYRDRNGWCTVMLFKSVRVRGRCDPPPFVDISICLIHDNFIKILFSTLVLKHVLPAQLGLNMRNSKLLANNARNLCTRILKSPTPTFRENCAGAPPAQISHNLCTFFKGIAKGGVKNRNKQGGVSVCLRLSTFSCVCLRFRLCVFASAFVCFCLRLFAFARICLLPALLRPPLWEKLNLGVSKPGCFPLFSGKVQIVSWTLSGLFLVGAVNRPRKRKRTNRENPRTIPEQIGKTPEKSQKDKKGQKRKDKSRSGNPPRLKPPRLAALDLGTSFAQDFSGGLVGTALRTRFWHNFLGQACSQFSLPLYRQYTFTAVIVL